MQDRPLTLWLEQLEYVQNKSPRDLRNWLERLYEGIPFPVLLSGTDPSVFAIQLYNSGPIEFQQRFRDAMRDLALSYSPRHKPGSHYLVTLVWVCGQIRIVEAYEIFMELIYSRAFEGEFATDHDKAAGHDVHSHLLAAAATLRPHGDGILDYCRRVLKGDLSRQYSRLAYEILWKAKKEYAVDYFGQFIDDLAECPELELLETARSHYSAIMERYGSLSLNGRARELLESCAKGPSKDIRVRRARVRLYYVLWLHGVRPLAKKKRVRKLHISNRKKSFFTDDDYTYEEMCREFANELQKTYSANSLESVYDDIPIANAIEVYVSKIADFEELEKIFAKEDKFYAEELSLLRIAAQRPISQSEMTGWQSRRARDWLGSAISSRDIGKKLLQALKRS